MMRFLALVAVAVSFSSYGCERGVEASPESRGPSGKGHAVSSLSTNPYEWAGIEHNEALDYVMSNAGVFVAPSVFPDSIFNDFVRQKVVDFYVSSGTDPNLTLSLMRQYTAGVDDIWHDVNALFDRADSVVTYPSVWGASFSYADKFYTQKVIDLARAAVEDSAYANFAALQVAVEDLEEEILAENWEEDDFLALMSIAIFKHSLELHNDHSFGMPPVSAKSKAVRIAAGASADFLAGVVTAGLVVGGSGGVGAGAAVWAGVKAAAGASGAVEMIGGWAGWW